MKTKPSFVYVVQQNETGPVKVGCTINLHSRINLLTTASAYPIRVLAIERGGRNTERKIHEAISEYRLQGEWFKCTPEVVNTIEEILKTELHEIPNFRKLPGVGPRLDPETYSPRPDSVSGQVLALLQSERDLPPDKRGAWGPYSISEGLGLSIGGVRQSLKTLTDMQLVRRIPARYEVTDKETT